MLACGNTVGYTGTRCAFGAKHYGPLSGVSSMPLKDAMRSREVSKRWRVAEREDGASPAARRALRGTLPLASRPCYASQSSWKSPFARVKAAAAPRSDSAEGGRGKPADPLPALGSHTEWMGPRGTCHLSALVCVRHGEHGRLFCGRIRRVGSRQGRPQRHAKARKQSRMGHRSLHPGKLGTPG